MKRVRAIINPVSGRGKGAALEPLIHDFLTAKGYEVETILTNAAGHAESLARETTHENADILLAVGGDGTINEVIAGALESALPLGVLPLGTGNVLAKELGIPKAPKKALEVFAADHRRRIDLCRLNDGRLFSCMLSAGIEGEIIRTLKEARAGGSMRMSQYLKLGIRALKSANYKIRVFRDGELWREGVSYATIANTHSFGGPVEIVPRAQCDDGKLDLMVSSAKMRYAYPGFMAAALMRQTSRLLGVEEMQTVDFRLESGDDRQVPFQFDGEFAGYLPIAGRILPAAIEMIGAKVET